MYLLNHNYFEYRKKLDLFFLSLCKLEDGKSVVNFSVLKDPVKKSSS